MAERDPLAALPDLARAGEEYAQPLPVERVRRLGQRRRTRRRLGVVAAAVVAAVVAGGTAWSGALLRTEQPPSIVVGSPSPAATASTDGPGVRRLTEANLITAAEVPNNGESEGERILVSDPGRGRTFGEVSACVPEGGWRLLGAEQTLSRNFEVGFQPPDLDPGPEHPLDDQPQIYTVALQFGSESEARRAESIFRSWLDNCLDELERRGYQGMRAQFDNRFVEVRSGTSVIGAYAAVPTYTPAGYTPPEQLEDFMFWEHVGLTRVDDRLMVTVEVVFSSEFYDSDLPGGDPDTGHPANIQFGLVKAAAERLGR